MAVASEAGGAPSDRGRGPEDSPQSGHIRAEFTMLGGGAQECSTPIFPSDVYFRGCAHHKCGYRRRRRGRVCLGGGGWLAVEAGRAPPPGVGLQFRPLLSRRTRRRAGSMRACAFSSSARASATRSICARIFGSSGFSAASSGSSPISSLCTRCLEIHERQTMLLEDVIHLLPLIPSGAKLPDHFRLVYHRRRWPASSAPNSGRSRCGGGPSRRSRPAARWRRNSIEAQLRIPNRLRRILIQFLLRGPPPDSSSNNGFMGAAMDRDGRFHLS